MNKKLFLAVCVLVLNYQLQAGDVIDRTQALQTEAREHKNPNVTKQSHPVLYEMVKNLSAAANIAMPRYITVHGAERQIVMDSGDVHNYAANMHAWVDVMGDLYICREMLTDLSYEEVEGIVAIAIAQNAKNQPTTLLVTGLGTFAATFAGLYAIDQAQNGKLAEFFFPKPDPVFSRERYDRSDPFLFVSLVSAFAATLLVSHYLQKQSDLDAAKLKNAQQIINAIRARSYLEETYIKEDFFTRIAKGLKIDTLLRFLFYPVRSYTDDERVAYLQACK